MERVRHVVQGQAEGYGTLFTVAQASRHFRGEGLLAPNTGVVMVEKVCTCGIDDPARNGGEETMSFIFSILGFPYDNCQLPTSVGILD